MNETTIYVHFANTFNVYTLVCMYVVLPVVYIVLTFYFFCAIRTNPPICQPKITFPDTYTNACCSHPLHEIEVEREELNAFGIRKAAQRRLNYELGIPTNQIRPENFHYLTRIHYGNTGDGTWGEHEIDYILFLLKDVQLNPNMNEVSEVRYIKRQNLDEEIAKFDAPLTPWFRLILNHQLKIWWDNLHQLKKFEDHKTIHRY